MNSCRTLRHNSCTPAIGCTRRWASPRWWKPLTLVQHINVARPGQPEGFIDIGDGDCIPVPKKRAELWPSYDFNMEQALHAQLNALKHNNQPYGDHGVEVLYRFANFDPFQRCKYFGRSFDLGQFERFRRIMHTPYFSTLLEHTSVEVLSTLWLSERKVRLRINVTGYLNKEQRVYEMTMVQRLGGIYDGYWFTDQLVCDVEEFIIFGV